MKGSVGGSFQRTAYTTHNQKRQIVIPNESALGGEMRNLIYPLHQNI
jgi:hypothetical protein